MTSEVTSGILSSDEEREIQKNVSLCIREASPRLETYAANCDTMSRLLRTLVSNLNQGRAVYRDLVEMCNAYENLARNQEAFAEAMRQAQLALSQERGLDESNMQKALERSGVGAMQALKVLKGEKK